MTSLTPGPDLGGGPHKRDNYQRAVLGSLDDALKFTSPAAARAAMRLMESAVNFEVVDVGYAS